MDSPKKFVTERTKYFRTTNLNKMDEWAIDQIEERGCALISVGRDCNDDFGWTYSLGIYDTCGQPELITIGLPSKVAMFCLNEAASRMRAGIDVAKERQEQLLSNVACELRAVDPIWVKSLMNFANWYNGGTDYPALQIIYPDIQNRFQWESGFENSFLQPLLQADAPRTAIEQQFWDSNKSDSERFPDWKFPDKPHTKVFVSNAVQLRKEWISYVTHDLSDGAWQILGEIDNPSEDPKLACLHQVVEMDPTLVELADLPKGWHAEREAPGEPWERFEDGSDEADG